MAAVRLYVTLTLLLLATCFHSSEGGWWRRSSCSKVNCKWSAWSSWGSCNYVCSQYNMEKRTRRKTRGSSCGGSCPGLARDVRICTCSNKNNCVIIPENAAKYIPPQCC